MQQRPAHGLVVAVDALAVDGLRQRIAVPVENAARLFKPAAARDMRVIGLVDPVSGVKQQLSGEKADTADKRDGEY